MLNFFYSDQTSPFVHHASSLFSRSPVDILKFLFVRFVPSGTRILSGLGISILKPTETKFFYDVVSETLKLRRKSSQPRNDLVELLIFSFKRW